MVAGKMSLEQATAYIRVAARFSKQLCFTGGEPLLYPREILELTSLATGMGLHVSLVTGAGWVRDEATVERRVEELVDAGLHQLTISWDAYHEEFGMRRGAVSLAHAARRAGLRVAVRIVAPSGVDSSIYREAFGDLAIGFEETKLIRLGRAASLPPDHFSTQDSPPRGACLTVMSTLIHHDGKVFACCGPSDFSAAHSPLLLGDAGQEPLEAILTRAEQDPLLEVIALLGPYGLYRLLLKTELKDAYQRKGDFTSICDLCLDLTNEPRFVQAIRKQLESPEAQILLTAARLWMKHKQGPEWARRFALPGEEAAGCREERL